MRLEPVKPEPVFAVRCLRCNFNGMSDTQAWEADLDGPPFRAYYCAACAAAIKLGAPKSSPAPSGGAR